MHSSQVNRSEYQHSDPNVLRLKTQIVDQNLLPGRFESEFTLENGQERTLNQILEGITGNITSVVSSWSPNEAKMDEKAAKLAQRYTAGLQMLDEFMKGVGYSHTSDLANTKSAWELIMAKVNNPS